LAQQSQVIDLLDKKQFSGGKQGFKTHCLKTDKT